MKVFGILLLLVALATVNVNAEYTFVRGKPEEAIVVEADVVGVKNGTKSSGATGATGATGGNHLVVFKEDAPEVVSEKKFEDLKKESASITGPEVLKGFVPEILDTKVKKHWDKKDQKKKNQEADAKAESSEAGAEGEDVEDIKPETEEAIKPEKEKLLANKLDLD